MLPNRKESVDTRRPFRHICGMCGRYAITLPPEAMRRVFAYREQPNFPPRYNIAPTQPVPVVRRHEGARQFILMRWGFLPGWVKDPKDYPLVINIRSESAQEKPSFRAALARRRCLMPADGFYEWDRPGQGSGKGSGQASGKARASQPYLFRRPDRGFFAFAALWETWHSPDGSEIDTVAMVTGPANGLMSAVHHRCPVLLDPRDFDSWLDPATEMREATSLLKPPPDEWLDMTRIGTAVNKVAHDGPQVQEPVSAQAAVPAPETRTPSRAKRPSDEDQGSLF